MFIAADLPYPILVEAMFRLTDIDLNRPPVSKYGTLLEDVISKILSDKESANSEARLQVLLLLINNNKVDVNLSLRTLTYSMDPSELVFIEWYNYLVYELGLKECSPTEKDTILFYERILKMLCKREDLNVEKIFASKTKNRRLQIIVLNKYGSKEFVECLLNHPGWKRTPETQELKEEIDEIFKTESLKVKK